MFCFEELYEESTNFWIEYNYLVSNPKYRDNKFYTYEEEFLGEFDELFEDDEDTWGLECFYCKRMVNNKHFYTNKELEKINKMIDGIKISCKDCYNNN